MLLEDLIQNTYLWVIGSGLRILLILALMFLLSKVARRISKKLFDKYRASEDVEVRKRADTLSSIVSYTLVITVLTVGAVMILGVLNIEIGPILAAAGVLGLAVGFGAQNLVADVISGFFILLEDQVRVGDVVTIAGKSGLVERITLRMVVLRDLSGVVHFVRNGQIDIVSNMTKEYSFYVFDLGVAYREDVDEVMQVVREVGEELRGDEKVGSNILEPVEIFGVDGFADSAVMIKARIKTKPIQQWAVGRAFNRLLKKRFDELGIEIPFPHVTLYMGQDKDGSAPAMNVHMDSGPQETV